MKKMAGRRVQQMGPKSGNTFLKKVTTEVAPRVSQRLEHQGNGESLALRGSVSQNSNIWNAQSQRKSAGTGHPEAVMGRCGPRDTAGGSYSHSQERLGEWKGYRSQENCVGQERQDKKPTYHGN